MIHHKHDNFGKNTQSVNVKLSHVITDLVEVTSDKTERLVNENQSMSGTIGTMLYAPSKALGTH